MTLQRLATSETVGVLAIIVAIRTASAVAVSAVAVAAVAAVAVAGCSCSSYSCSSCRCSCSFVSTREVADRPFTTVVHES